MEDDKRKYITIIIILLFLIIGVITLHQLTGDRRFTSLKTKRETNSIKTEEEVISNKSSNDETNKNENTDEESIYTSEEQVDLTNATEIYSWKKEEQNQEPENKIFSLTANRELVYNSSKFKNKIIGKNIVVAKQLYYTKSDVCMGNSILVMVDETGNISAVSIDSLECNQPYGKLEYFVKLKDITNIVDVYNEKVDDYPNEPPYYNVMAKKQDGTVTDITNYFSNN